MIKTELEGEKMKKKIKNSLLVIVLILEAIIIVGSIYYKKSYTKQDFDLILYYLFNGANHSSPDVVVSVIKACILPVLALFTVMIVPIIENVKHKLIIKVGRKEHKKNVQLYPIKYKVIYVLVILIVAISIFIKCFGVNEYIKYRRQDTKVYEDYYVDARKVKIKFPEEKRNLIMIVVESMENTVLSKENGGSWDYSITPELEKLAIENTNFSNNNLIGGAYQTYGSDYSAAGNVAITAGIPLKTVDFLNNENNYSGNGQYLSGAYTLGEILKEQGYNLEIMMGSDAEFGGRQQYYTANGQYKIFDTHYAIEHGKMTEEDRVWWGFEDDKLYEWSKEEILDLANQNKPFNYIMLTADTHFMDGYLSQRAAIQFDTKYENVYAYSSKSIYEFIEWLKEQDFYDNTTIVIVGDHLGMQVEFYESRMDENYERTIYNIIINSAIEVKNNKNRTFTSMDLYPTMLASIGVEIEGERLGLGTNLYSGEPTVSEKLGLETFKEEIKKNSTFYNKRFFGDDYYVIKKSDKEENDKENIKNEVQI